MKYELKLKNKNISDDEIISDLNKVATKIQKSSISSSDYETYGQYNIRTVSRRFESWSKALEIAGLKPAIAMNIDRDDLFENLQNIWIQLGRQPVRSEIKRPLSKYSCSPYLRLFNTWNNALIEFIKWVEEDDETKERELISPREENNKNQIIHKTNRQISDRMRFRILMRDGFSCQSCGRSPINERGVKLHVDHIMPWSKGGETIEENLITKCKKCNLGKGNTFNV